MTARDSGPKTHIVLLYESIVHSSTLSTNRNRIYKWLLNFVRSVVAAQHSRDRHTQECIYIVYMYIWKTAASTRAYLKLESALYRSTYKTVQSAIICWYQFFRWPCDVITVGSAIHWFIAFRIDEHIYVMFSIHSILYSIRLFNFFQRYDVVARRWNRFPLAHFFFFFAALENIERQLYFFFFWKNIYWSVDYHWFVFEEKTKSKIINIFEKRINRREIQINQDLEKKNKTFEIRKLFSRAA